MNSADIITTIAEVSIALIGFSAVVVVLNPTPIRDWSDVDRLNLRVLIQVGAFATAFSVFPFLTHIYFEPVLAWKYALLVYGFAHIADIASFVLRIPKHGTKTNRIMLPIGFLVAIVQIVSGFVASAKVVELVYVASLAWHLCVAFMGFVLLIYQGRRQGDA